MAGTDLVRFECSTGCEGSEWDVWGDWIDAENFRPENGLDALRCPSCLVVGRYQPDEED
jgi:hypothetical protein